MKIRVIITGHGFNYHATIEGEPSKKGCGRTPEKAVSDLIGVRWEECKDGIEIVHEAAQ